jgi:hypothetical protein
MTTTTQIRPRTAVTTLWPTERTPQEALSGPRDRPPDRPDPQNCSAQPLDFHRSPEGEPRSPIVDAGLCICTTGLGQRVRAVSALMGCARSERPDENDGLHWPRRDGSHPDEASPLRQGAGPPRSQSLEASVRPRCRESSKRSSASVPAGVSFRGEPVVRRRQAPRSSRRQCTRAPQGRLTGKSDDQGDARFPRLPGPRRAWRWMAVVA